MWSHVAKRSQSTDDVAWRHQAISWTNVGFKFCGFHDLPIDSGLNERLFCEQHFLNIIIIYTINLYTPGGGGDCSGSGVNFYLLGSTVIPVWISNYMPSKCGMKSFIYIYSPFLNLNGANE